MLSTILLRSRSSELDNIPVHPIPNLIIWICIIFYCWAKESSSLREALYDFVDDWDGKKEIKKRLSNTQKLYAIIKCLIKDIKDNRLATLGIFAFLMYLLSMCF